MGSGLECFDVFIDWDLDHFERSMRTAEVLVTWDLPSANLAEVAPNLRPIHVIGAGDAGKVGHDPG